MGQPGNSLVNRLGFSNLWRSPLAERYNNFYSTHFTPNALFLLRVYINSGIIHAYNLFITGYWNSNVRFLSIPVIRTFGSFSKFYRIATIHNARLNLKKKYVLRKSSDDVNVVTFQPIRHKSAVWFFLFTPVLELNQLRGFSNAFRNWNRRGSGDFLEYVNSVYAVFKLYNHI